MAIDKFMSKNISDLSKIIGININDLSRFMGHNVSTYVFKDTFTGSNGSDPNPTYWDPDTHYEIQDNQLHGTVNGNSGYIQSNFLLSGDFDVFISFDDLITGTTYGNSIAFVVGSSDLSEAGVISIRWYNIPTVGAKFLGNIKHNGSYYGEVIHTRSNDYGGARAIRVGTNLILQRKDGEGAWTTITSNTVDADDFIIRLNIVSISGNVSGDWDDFIINSGTMGMI